MSTGLTRIIAHKWLILSALVLPLAILLRSLALGQGYWIDEVSSLQTARLSWGELVHRVGFFDLHPPLYYFSLSMWTGVFGEGEIAARFMSLLFSIATLAVVYFWGARRSAWTGFLALLIMALSTLHVHYSVEVRSYSMLAFFGAAFLCLYEKAAGEEECNWLDWLLLGVVESCFILTHYYAIPLVALANLHFFTVRPHDGRRLFRWCMVQGTGLVLFMAWLPFLLVQFLHLPEGMFAHLQRDASVARLLLSFGPATVHPSSTIAWLSAGLLLGAAVGSVVRSVRAGLRKATPGPQSRPETLLGRGAGRLVAAVLLVASVAPMVTAASVRMSETTLPLLLQELPRCYMLLFLAAFLLLGGTLVNARVLDRGHRLEAVPAVVILTVAFFAGLFAFYRPFLPRNLIFLLPAVCILAASLWQPRGALAQISLLVLVLSTTVPSLVRSGTNFEPRQDFKTVAQSIRGEASRSVGRGTANFVIPMWDRPGVEFYLGQGTANGIMSPSQIPHQVNLPATVNVILTRAAFDNHRLFVDTVARLLSPDYKLKYGERFRQVYLVTFERTSNN